ncbi:hypothetical protein SARC_01609 [Sphaeroforma arctica JP610]|uniref:Bromo domain-containing protein n=1 Tax=Sphaeroforma arctica JP610 TaxID=667725 RepID=A0A0L0GBF0_9EUKA|nr:hypothetical protein SARC_01609 [Sphaeroforma arctica JP610]KNC86234.1 hypothetical protein SARC_01609 [Sphaeroforma arctica JP610]|eukprot:XP_014160136.1 hypothetical protein SARC_01609 [Sphaeroforma arctica JP610]
MNNTLMHLRKLCNHPYLFPEVESMVHRGERGGGSDLIRVSGKVEVLDRVLRKLIASGHRALLFTTMTQLITILEDYLVWAGIKYLRLDGSVKADDRGEMIRIFNAPDSEYNIFLLSTRAGGLGLNLQTADTVIIYDSDWNPFQDLQAQDRAHRIGQKNEVRVLRFLTVNSIEEYVLESAERKRNMDAKIIQAGRFDNKSTSEERRRILEDLLQKDEEDTNDLVEPSSMEEINRMLARSDEEVELFAEIDLEINAEAGGADNRLISAEEVPELYLESVEEVTKKYIVEDKSAYGRGRRAHKEVEYDDNLTELQWTKAVDDGTLPEFKRRAKARRDQSRSEGIIELDSDENDSDRPTKKSKKRSRKGDRSRGDSPMSAKHSKKRRKKKMPQKVVVVVQDHDETDSDGNDNNNTSNNTNNNTNNNTSDNNTDNEDSHSSANGGARGDEASEVSEVEEPPRVKKARVSSKKLKKDRHLSPSPKRRSRIVSPTPVREDSVYMHCYTALTTLLDPETDEMVCELFMEVPNLLDYPDYKIIEYPIALSNILEKIDNTEYETIEDMEVDVKLMVSNAQTFNQEDSFVYEYAGKLQTEFYRALYEYEKR